MQKMQKMRKGERTRNRIFQAASDLFLREDFERVTVDAIVEKAGVSKGTFYLYFESKDELIASLLSDYVSGLDTEYKAHVDALPPDVPGDEALLSLVGKICDIICFTVGYDSIMNLYKVHLTGKASADVVHGYNRKLYAVFTQVIERGVRRGEFCLSVPIEELARHFVLALRVLCFEWCVHSPDFDLKANARRHFRLLIDAIRAKKA